MEAYHTSGDTHVTLAGIRCSSRGDNSGTKDSLSSVGNVGQDLGHSHRVKTRGRGTERRMATNSEFRLESDQQPLVD